jgi:FMN phosphatase YigB (HAD superfamily)
MTDQVEAILFDMGGTLRWTVRRTRHEKQQTIRQMMELVGVGNSRENFSRLLSRRAKAYKSWAERTHIELNERDLWTQWMLPDFPAEQISNLAVQLNQLYREANGSRVIFPESPEVILELFRRGYRLGLVSNTTSSIEAPALLRIGADRCFETVVLSAVVGKRKPNPAILLMRHTAWEWRLNIALTLRPYRPRWQRAQGEFQKRSFSTIRQTRLMQRKNRI